VPPHLPPPRCNHDFAVHTRKSFRRVLCHACGEKIGGVLVKVMKCRACKIKFHMRCVLLVLFWSTAAHGKWLRD
jgi:hypothetical protein